MTRVIQEDGTVVPVTVVECTANTISAVKTADKHGYNALVLGFSPLKKEKKTKKYQHLKEIRVEDTSSFEVGKEIDTKILEGIETVSITGVSKGKGFQGVIKRHNFSRGPETHGSHHHREPGSIGQCAKPGRVNKGKKMAGRMGTDQVTRKKVKVVQIDHDKSLVALKGSVPGAPGSLVIIKCY